MAHGACQLSSDRRYLFLSSAIGPSYTSHTPRVYIVILACISLRSLFRRSRRSFFSYKSRRYESTIARVGSAGINSPCRMARWLFVKRAIGLPPIDLRSIEDFNVRRYQFPRSVVYVSRAPRNDERLRNRRWAPRTHAEGVTVNRTAAVRPM